MAAPATPPTAAYQAALRALQQQQRARLTLLIQQTESALHKEWQAGPAIAAQFYRPVLDEYAKALADLRLSQDDPYAKLAVSWLNEQNAQLRSIEASVQASMTNYAGQAARTVEEAQNAALGRGVQDASRLTQEALFPASRVGVNPDVLFNRPNPDAIGQWLGRAGNGHPLGDLFANFPQEATTEARKAMLFGLATGANPKALASGIANAMGISRSRALIISRTEVLGSYRAAAHETYRANSDVLAGWLWSAGGANPCALCMGMDGTFHGLWEDLSDHPCGKCSPLPVTKDWSEIFRNAGFGAIDTSALGDTRITRSYVSGEERFAKMSPERQRTILGTQTGYEAYKRGEVTLKDFVGVRPGENGFPPSYYQRSLKELQIPTQRGLLVQPSPDLTEKWLAGELRASHFGRITPDELMPAWAKQSDASRIVYQIMRNGLPDNMRGHELGLVTTNLEQMLKQELPLNVRIAALKQLDVLQQYDRYLDLYVRNVTRGASTLGEPPAFVYRPSKELERALSAARAGERTALEQTVTGTAARDIGRVGKLSDEEFQQAVLNAHVRNADSSGYSAIRQIRNEVVQQTGISRAEFDARLRAWYDAAAQHPDDLVVHFETNMDAHPGIRGRLSVDGRQYDFLQMSRGSEFERIIAGEAPAGNAYAGSLRGITREAFEAERGIGAASVLGREATGAAINLERMTAEQLATEEAHILAAIRPPWDDAIRAQERAAEALGPRLAGNAEFLKLGPKVHAYLTDLAGFSNLRVNDPEEIAAALLRAWSGGTDNAISRALRQAIQDEFGIAGRLVKPATEWADVQPGLRVFVREIYNNTQDYLRENGISELPLFRGNTLRELPRSIDAALLDGKVHEIQVALQAASSFTADEKWAAEFATFSQSGNAEYGVAMAGRIPAELVLSMAQTGLGNISEAEVILLGGNYDLAMIGARLAETKLTPEEIASLLTQPLERAALAAGQVARSAAEAGFEDGFAIRAPAMPASREAQAAETAAQAAEPVVEKVASQEALDALAQAQARVGAVEQQYREALAADRFAHLPKEADEALWDLARAQARVDAENGGRGAIVRAINSDNPFGAQAELAKITENMFGHSLTSDELASLVGAPENSFVSIFSDEKTLRISLDGPAHDPLKGRGFGNTGSGYWAERELVMRGKSLVMTNEDFFIDDELQGQGLGARIFADEAQSLSRLGVSRIDTYAAGWGEDAGRGVTGANGYYTWPRFGYTGKLPEGALTRLGEAVARGDVPANWSSYTTVQQLMRTPEGRAWWKANGEGLTLRFDLNRDSYSMRVLREYLASKGISS